MFFWAGLNEKTKVCLSGDEPLGNFKEYVEWVLLHNVSPFTICKSEEENSMPAPAISPATMKPVPTTGTELDPATIGVPAS